MSEAPEQVQPAPAAVAVEPAAAGKPRRTRLGIALVVGGYAIPLVVAVVLLFFVYPVIAIGLAVVECSTILGIRFAMRAPDPHARRDRLPGEPILGLPGDARARTGRDFAKVATGMIGIVLALALVAVIASHFG